MKNLSSTSGDLPRLSRKEVLILNLLVNSGKKLFGLEMIEASGDELKRGTVYVMLHRMEEKGLVESEQERRTAPEIGIPRRLYQVSGYGRRVFAAYEAAQSVMASKLIPVGS
jgi:DNA-binding PadR family transcriptional regulator